MKTTIYLPLLAAGAMLLLSTESCSLYKEYQTPDSTPITAEYVKARTDTTANQFGNTLWENVFTDPVLADYINQALANNNSLKNAQINIELAQTQLRGAKLAYFPSVAIAPNGNGSSYSGNSFNWTYSIPLSVSWEADIFGKLRNSQRSAQAAVLQSAAYAQAVRSQIVAGVANCYYGIASVEKQLQLYKSTAELWKETVNTMRNLKEAGRTTEAAVVQAEANYYSILGGITDLEMNLRQLNNTMSLLLNVMPQEWAVPVEATLDLPVFLNEGVPMSVLACRPDVAAAEQNMAIAFYGVNQARANFYPSLVISAQAGLTNLLGGMIKNPGDFFAQLAGSITAPIFSRGQNEARLQAARLQQQQALNNFEYTLLSAASEVENSLVKYNKSIERSALLEKQIADLEKSVEYTNDLLLYSTGTYLEVITAQQNLLSAQMGLLSTRLATVQAIINLYQAVGGGR